MKINETVPHEIIIPGFPMISMPIISPDGKYFSLYVGNGQLIIFADKIFSPGSVFNFYIGTEPSFSPDGKYLAYYEKIGIFGPVNLKIINTDHPEEVIYTKEFQNLLNPMPGNATIDWSNDGRYIIYTSVDATLSTDIIHVDEVFGNTDYELKINGIGAYMPSLSPDKTEVVFAARDGNIWTRTIADERYTRMTEVDSTIEYNLYPQWTNDGKYIFYTKYYRDDTSKFGGTLEIVNLSTKKRLVLSNSILRGYKMRIKT
ncbi:MAG: PD40 domain-containing protein [Ignavibacteriae bacterium]|nr:PD40 domain-containing protein [Ignavibacteriota bacterium]